MRSSWRRKAVLKSRHTPHPFNSISTSRPHHVLGKMSRSSTSDLNISRSRPSTISNLAQKPNTPSCLSPTSSTRVSAVSMKLSSETNSRNQFSANTPLLAKSLDRQAPTASAVPGGRAKSALEKEKPQPVPTQHLKQSTRWLPSVVQLSARLKRAKIN